MDYSNELCQLVIKNMMVVEKAPEVVDQITERLFEKINERIKDRISKQTDWKGEYDLLTDESGGTTFAPKDWPEDENGNYLAYYYLSGLRDNNIQNWLSIALGLEGSYNALCFDIDKDYLGMTSKQKNRTLENLSQNPRLVNAGFSYNINLGIYLPFSFLPDKVAEEYPDFDESLAPLDESLDALISVHDIFDDFVKTISQKNDEKTLPESME
ncbi:MAG: hypothetical protein LBQ36_04635 [Synergistaceae bacterium]|jgi:hypothetical protein|nr:hypothetical protein [Synergistaceae bacterium]